MLLLQSFFVHYCPGEKESYRGEHRLYLDLS